MFGFLRLNRHLEKPDRIRTAEPKRKTWTHRVRCIGCKKIVETSRKNVCGACYTYYQRHGTYQGKERRVTKR